MAEQEDHSCWTCDHNRLGGVTMFGNCDVVTRNNPGGSKPIPAEIVGIGCGKFWKERTKKEPEPEFEFGE
jgi:hypothetical protein